MQYSEGGETVLVSADRTLDCATTAPRKGEPNSTSIARHQLQNTPGSTPAPNIRV